jgi:antitoxin component YwqK of YwqJK toxin-antitoxin module
MNQFNDKRQYHGYWEQYYPDGKLSYKGNFINDEYIGYWEWYEKNGSLINKEFHL